jgi:hypothetical protein
MRALRYGLILLYLATFSAVTYYSITGYSYYRTAIEERPRHEDYWQLKPGGSKGLAFGIVGSSLMVMMLVYTMRKRIPGLRRFGQLKLWLHFHIFCGIAGPLLVILHSSFKVQGLVALSFWSMIIVALSGFVGRYLYQQVPRQRSGAELTLEQTRQRSAALGGRLVAEYALDPDKLEQLNQIATGGLADHRRLLWVLLAMPWQSLAVRWRLRRFAATLGVSNQEVLGELRSKLASKATLDRRIRMWSELQRLFYYWHILHKPFAVIMYIFMVIHIGVAVATGYGGF